MQLKDSNYKLSDTMTATVDQDTAVSSVDAIQTWLVNQLSKQLSLPAKNVKIDEPLTRYGLDSIDSVTVVGDLEDWLGQELPSTLLWDYPTIEKAAQHLVNELGVSATGVAAAAAAPAAEPEKASAGKGWGLWGRG